MSVREYGTITNVFLGTEDHGILTCNIQIGFKGSSQGFGNLCLGDETMAKDFVDNLCTIFGVSKLEQLKGRNCYALRCFDEWNALIEGLEADGPAGTFLLTKWRRRHRPETKNPLEEKREALVSRAQDLARQVSENAAAIARLDASYTDWETR